MFHVLENNKPAVLKTKTEERWLNNKFDTFEKAVDYTNDWLGEYSPVPKNWDGKPYYYAGDDDFVSIEYVHFDNLK